MQLMMRNITREGNGLKGKKSLFPLQINLNGKLAFKIPVPFLPRILTKDLDGATRSNLYLMVAHKNFTFTRHIYNNTHIR